MCEKFFEILGIIKNWKDGTIGERKRKEDQKSVMIYVCMDEMGEWINMDGSEGLLGVCVGGG